MDFKLTEKQQMARDLAAQFAEKELAPKAKAIDERAEVERETLEKMGEANLLGIMLPEPLGAGLDTLSYVLAVEELAAVCPSLGVVVSAQTMASFAMLAFGQDSIKKEALPALGSGKAIGALSVAEPNAGSDTMGLEAFGKPAKGGFSVSGNKIFASNAGRAGYFAVLFKTSRDRSPQAFTLGIIKKDTPGFSIGKKEDTLGLRGDDLRELVLRDCFIPQENILGPVGGGLMPTMAAGGLGALGVAATAVGAARACLTLSLAYAKERNAFGGSIANQQVIQLYVSEMTISISAARLLLHKAAWGRDQSDKDPAGIWTARIFSTDMARRVGELAQNIHAAYGYTKEYAVGRFVRDLQGLPFVFGTQEILKTFLAKTVLGLPLF